MNIISNTCLGGYCYKKLGIQFQNPFIYTRLLPSELTFIAENYNIIDFSNITKLYLAPQRAGNHELIPFMEIDGKFIIEFVHVRLDKDAKDTYQTNSNTFTSDQLGYAREKYLERLKRMVDPPIFLLHYHKVLPTWLKEVERFVNAKSKYKRYVVTEHLNLYNNLFTIKTVSPSGIVYKKTKTMRGLAAAAIRKFHIDRMLKNEMKNAKMSEAEKENPT